MGVSTFRLLVELEAPVHISPLQITSVVAHNDTIWICNRHDPELKVIS